MVRFSFRKKLLEGENVLQTPVGVYCGGGGTCLGTKNTKCTEKVFVIKIRATFSKHTPFRMALNFFSACSVSLHRYVTMSRKTSMCI